MSVAVIFFCMAGITGCVTPRSSAPVAQATPPMAATMAYRTPAVESLPGENSLWRDNAQLVALFADNKAVEVGDLLTIKIVESAMATNNASTDTGRNTNLLAGIDNLLGLEQKYTNPDHPGYKPFRKINPFGKIQANFENSFSGTGTTARSGDLTGFLTARVTGRLHNGNLQIRGVREIKVNNESQLLTLTGIVRAKDVSAENIVLSTYVADARITYSGTGVINDKQKPGWLARTIDNVWPF